MSGRGRAKSPLSLFSSDEEQESSSDVRRNPRSPVRRLASTSQAGTEHGYGTSSQAAHVATQVGFVSQEDIRMRTPSESGSVTPWWCPTGECDRYRFVACIALFAIAASIAGYLIYQELAGVTNYFFRKVIIVCFIACCLIVCLGGGCVARSLSKRQVRSLRRRIQTERLSSARIAGAARPSAMRASRDPMPSTSGASRPDVPVEVESLQTGPASHGLRPPEYIELRISSPTSRAIVGQFLGHNVPGLARDPVSSRSGTCETSLSVIPSAKGARVPPTTRGQGEERARFRVPRLSSSQEAISSATPHSEDSPGVMTRAARARAQLEQMRTPPSTTPQGVQPGVRTRSQSETDLSTQDQTTPVRRSERISKKKQ